MEREFELNMVEEPSGRVCLCWDELRLSVRAVCPLRGEGLVKLWLVGETGRMLLGTLIPDRGRLTLSRCLTIAELCRKGAWPPAGVESMVVWPFCSDKPFPRPDLFCLAQVEGERVKICFDGEGWPVFRE